jgi:hypothetical protein
LIDVYKNKNFYYLFGRREQSAFVFSITPVSLVFFFVFSYPSFAANDLPTNILFQVTLILLLLPSI